MKKLLFIAIASLALTGCQKDYYLEDLNAAEQTVSTQENQINNLSSLVNSLESELTSSRAANNTLQGEINNLLNQVNDLTQQIEDLLYTTVYFELDFIASSSKSNYDFTDYISEDSWLTAREITLKRTTNHKLAWGERYKGTASGFKEVRSARLESGQYIINDDYACIGCEYIYPSSVFEWVVEDQIVNIDGTEQIVKLEAKTNKALVVIEGLEKDDLLSSSFRKGNTSAGGLNWDEDKKAFYSYVPDDYESMILFTGTSWSDYETKTYNLNIKPLQKVVYRGSISANGFIQLNSPTKTNVVIPGIKAETSKPQDRRTITFSGNNLIPDLFPGQVLGDGGSRWNYENFLYDNLDDFNDSPLLGVALGGGRHNSGTQGWYASADIRHDDLDGFQFIDVEAAHYAIYFHYGWSSAIHPGIEMYGYVGEGANVVDDDAIINDTDGFDVKCVLVSFPVGDLDAAVIRTEYGDQNRNNKNAYRTTVNGVEYFYGFVKIFDGDFTGIRLQGYKGETKVSDKLYKDADYEFTFNKHYNFNLN